VADSAVARAPRWQSLLLKLWRVAVQYVRQHAEAAQAEGARDLRRLAMGLAFCACGAIFAVHAIIFLHAVAVVLLSRIPGAQIEFVLVGIFGGDLLIALCAVLIGASMLRRPLLPKTRAVIKEVQTFLAEV